MNHPMAWRGKMDGLLASPRPMASLNLTTWFSLVQGRVRVKGGREDGRLAGGPGWHDGERLSGPLE